MYLKFVINTSTYSKGDFGREAAVQQGPQKERQAWAEMLQTELVTPIGSRRLTGGVVVCFADEQHRSNLQILAAGVVGCPVRRVCKRVVFLYLSQVFLVGTYSCCSW